METQRDSGHTGHGSVDERDEGARVGPLPPRYAVAVALGCVLVGGGLGTWIASLSVAPSLMTAGAAVGIIGGLALAALFLHDFRPTHRRTSLPRNR